MLVPERLVEGVGVRPAVRGVQHQVAGSSPLSFLLERVHQELTDAAAAERLRDNEARDLATGLIALDQVLLVERGETGEPALGLGHDDPGGRVSGDPCDAGLGLFRCGRIREFGEQRRIGGGVFGRRLAEAYGGGGPGGTSSST